MSPWFFCVYYLLLFFFIFNLFSLKYFEFEKCMVCKEEEGLKKNSPAKIHINHFTLDINTCIPPHPSQRLFFSFNDSFCCLFLSQYYNSHNFLFCTMIGKRKNQHTKYMQKNSSQFTLGAPQNTKNQNSHSLPPFLMFFQAI